MFDMDPKSRQFPHRLHASLERKFDFQCDVLAAPLQRRVCWRRFPEIAQSGAQEQRRFGSDLECVVKFPSCVKIG